MDYSEAVTETGFCTQFCETRGDFHGSVVGSEGEEFSSGRAGSIEDVVRLIEPKSTLGGLIQAA